MVSERKNLDWNNLAKELENMMRFSVSPATDFVMKVCDDAIEITPAKTNLTGAFYYTEEVVDFSRCKGLSNYVSIYDGKVTVRIY